MTAFQDAFTAMTEAGIEPARAAQLLSNVVAGGVRSNTPGAIRARRFRGRKRQGVTGVTGGVTGVTPNDEIPKKSTSKGVTGVTLPGEIPPHPPKNLPSEERKKEESKNLDSCASRGFPPSAAVVSLTSQAPPQSQIPAPRKIVTEYDLVLSNGGGVIEHEIFEALNEEFGITNARDRAGAAKRTYLKDVTNPQWFINRFRQNLINQRNKPVKVPKPSAAQREAERIADEARAEDVRQSSERRAAFFAKMKARRHG